MDQVEVMRWIRWRWCGSGEGGGVVWVRLCGIVTVGGGVRYADRAIIIHGRVINGDH